MGTVQTVSVQTVRKCHKVSVLKAHDSLCVGCVPWLCFSWVRLLKKSLLPVPVFQGKQADLWVDSIRAVGAGRIAELPPTCQMDFVQFSLELSTMLVCFCEFCGFCLSLIPTRHPGNTIKII